MMEGAAAGETEARGGTRSGTTTTLGGGRGGGRGCNSGSSSSSSSSHGVGSGGSRMETGTLGFPHLGSRRELKYALEAYWDGELDDQDLLDRARQVEEEAWRVQAEAGVDFIGVGDFALYDWTLDWVGYLGCTPKRFLSVPPGLARYFAMARGAEGGIAPLEMRKWFDTNYQYQVPELIDEGEMEQPSANFDPLLQSIARAITKLGGEGGGGGRRSHGVVPMLLGPITFMWLGHVRPTTTPSSQGVGGDRVGSLLGQLLPLYEHLLHQLADMGITEVQMHEPAMVTQDGISLLPYFKQAYNRLLSVPKPAAAAASGGGGGGMVGVDLVTYFGEVHEEVFTTLIAMPFTALSLDFTSTATSSHDGGGGTYIPLLEGHGFPSEMRLGLGALDGRSVWKPDPGTVFGDIALLRRAVRNIRLQTSCSLQHLPYSVTQEPLPPPPLREVWSLVSFAAEKLADLRSLAIAMDQQQESRDLEEAWVATRLWRDTSYEVVAHDQAMAAAVKPQDFERGLSYEDRRGRQMRSKLPLLPTSAIGPFPRQTPVTSTPTTPTGKQQEEEGGQGGLDASVRESIAAAIRLQEEAGLDLLVPGSGERLDMVEEMARCLEGVCVTSHGWVRVYGSRCVRPPIIVADVSRKRRGITVQHFQYAQSLTTKVVKAELVGPMTLLNWSFPRADKAKREQCLQLALCVRDEVRDLEIAGARVIAVDEPGFREGLPLQGQKRIDYLQFCGRAFRLATCIAGPHIEIHMHVAHTEIASSSTPPAQQGSSMEEEDPSSSVIPALLEFDADVYLVENARSRGEVLREFQSHGFPRSLGVGVLDVHSPIVPSTQDMVDRLHQHLKVLPAEQLLVVPDSSLRSRTPEQAKQALHNMVQATLRVRSELQQQGGVGGIIMGRRRRSMSMEGPADPPAVAKI